MLNSLKIKNFRCFEEFELQQLGRVNLLVGKNNCGKTSILEAIHILDSGKPGVFWNAIRRRRESDISSKVNSLANISNFCVNHDLARLPEILISGSMDNTNTKFNFLISENLESESQELVAKGHPTNQNVILVWTNFKGISSHKIPFQLANDDSFDRLFKTPNNIFISDRSTGSINMVDLFNEIILLPFEEILYEALRFIEPSLHRIAPVKNGSFVVAIDGQRVPIGSMGDGIWRMLEITLAMVNVSGGILLIDEIDTGLHFSVMLDLWRLICRTAEKLDIQVFATTHSSDCWKSLAEVAQSNEFPETEITIHRIEKGKKASVVFNEQEMAIAAERDIEVR
jgi:AAA15 family ATPase/GTPase